MAGAPAERGAPLRLEDGIVLAYFLILAVAVMGGHGEHRTACLRWLACDLGVLGAGLAVLRAGMLGRGAMAEAFRRFLLAGLVVTSFIQLRYILPVVTMRALDAQIVSFDRSVFGYEPSLAWDRWVSHGTVEWFSFFYFSYFFLVAVHVLVVPFLLRQAHVAQELMLGLLLVYCIAHLTYMVVPGFGPYRFFADRFQHPIEGGFWWECVARTVDAGGAQKDIFPSLHTAAPSFIAIFSLRHRKVGLFRWSWPVMAFFASQIVLATMFLRWHYLIDIVAGLTLAGSVSFLASTVMRERGKMIRS